MTKSIIKRIIVGLSIAILFSMFRSCNVKATTVEMVFQNGHFYKENNQVSTNSSSVNINGTPFLTYYATTSYTGGLPSFYFENVKDVNNTTGIFKVKEYFSFIVWSNLTPSAVQFRRWGLICEGISQGVATQNSAGTYNNYTVFECTTNGIDQTGTNDAMTIYFSEYQTANITPTMAISKNFYFYDDSLKTSLNEIKYLLNGTNTTIESILSQVTTQGTTLNTIKNNLNTLNSKLDSTNQAIINQTTTQHTDAQQTQTSINNVNNTLNDDDTSNVDTNAISSANDNLASNGNVSDLITLPITLFTAVLNSISAGCFQYNLGNLLGTNLVLPCINLENILGSALYHTIDVIISGLFVFYISRKILKIFNELSSLERGSQDL